MKRRRSAFSLVEMLVVIAVILVIASVMFPVVSQTKARAKETVCASNVRQLYLAQKLYQGDHGDYAFHNFNQPEWLPYMGGTFLRCPLAPPDAHPGSIYINLGMTVFEAWDNDPEYPNPRFRSDWLACRERREGEFPLVMDDWHVGADVAYRTGREFKLFARESGKIDSVPRKVDARRMADRAHLPCDPRLEPWNH